MVLLCNFASVDKSPRNPSFKLLLFELLVFCWLWPIGDGGKTPNIKIISITKRSHTFESLFEYLLPGPPRWSCKKGWTAAAAAAAALTPAAAAAEDPTDAARCDRSNGVLPDDIPLAEFRLWSRGFGIEGIDSFPLYDGKTENEPWPGAPPMPGLALEFGEGGRCPWGIPETPYRLAAKRNGLLDAAAATAAADGSPPNKWWYGANGGGLKIWSIGDLLNIQWSISCQ